MALTKEKVAKIYDSVMSRAQSEYGKGNYNKSLKYVTIASTWMYRFSLIYTDSNAENLLHNIAANNLPSVTIDSHNESRIVFIDNMGYDNVGLTQQYLRGLMSLGKEILYILHRPSQIVENEVIRELKEYDKAVIKLYDSSAGNYLEIARQIMSDVAEYSPKNIMLHLTTWDVLSLIVINNIFGVTKFNIDLTDHTYWIGASFVDYNIQFRGYGEVTSLQKRGMTDNQIIRSPFYPIVSKYAKFQGLPDLPEGSIKVFCGGTEYKMFGQNDIFFKMMDSVLEISPNVHIIVAGSATPKSIFGRKVSKMKHSERVHIIGFRKDINALFAHSDIFLSTYPLGGGLMTQYAAYNKLPILAYDDDNGFGHIEALVNHYSSPLKSQKSMADFISYAKRLIESKEYRINEGEKCHDAMMTEEKFNGNLNDLLEFHKTNIKWNLDQPNYDSKTSIFIDIENKYTHAAIITLYRQLQFKAIIIAPTYIPWMVLFVAKRLIRKCLKKIKSN